jgi:SAM-dependent methyltransferase
VIPDPDKVRVWEARAEAYDDYCRRTGIFSLLSDRLIDLLPVDLQGAVLDIGAGSGLTSGLLLARHPSCEVILIEPSQAMVDIARARLAGRRVRFLVMGLDGALALDLHASAAVASVSMQFIDLDPAFAALAQIIVPGGHVAFNFWYHHWRDTAHTEGMSGWKSIVEAACREAQLPPPVATSPPPNVKTRAELVNASRRHGFELLAEHRDEDVTPVVAGLDFQAMDIEWPVKGLEPAVRLALLQRMRELAQGKFESVISTRFLFQRGPLRRSPAAI